MNTPYFLYAVIRAQTQVVSRSWVLWVLWIMLLWTVCRFSCGGGFLFLLWIHLQAGLMAHGLSLCFTFWGMPKLLSKAVAPFPASFWRTNSISVSGGILHHLLPFTNICWELLCLGHWIRGWEFTQAEPLPFSSSYSHVRQEIKRGFDGYGSVMS